MYLCGVMDNIDNIIKRKGLTKTALAERLGIKKQNLNGLLKNPTLGTIRRIAEALGVNPRELFAVGADEVTALIECDGELYVAHDLRTLRQLVGDLEILKSERDEAQG